jgi:TrmH family RNA methyltransferase
MSGGLEGIRVVLVGSLYGGNVGSVCRAMANMGFSDLALAGPRNLNMDEARMMACHAAHILEGRTEFATLPEAVADCGLVIGTSARGGLYRLHARTPREWAAKALAAARTNRVALVFGPENDGLSNEQLALCTQIIQIPTVPEFRSINVAQAVMICCYEIFSASGAYEPPRERSEEAPSELRERMFWLWRETLFRIGFMKDDKADHMMMGLRRILSRGSLSVDDAHILMGIARQMQWAAEHAGPAGGPPAGVGAEDGRRRRGAAAG